jgi:F0F1-type ATP synthase assembly protein I
MTGTEGGKKGHEPVPNPGRTGISGAELAGGGIQFAAILVLSSFAGIWVDKQIGTSPWFLILLVFLGAAATFYSFYRKLMKGQRLGDRRKHTERREEGE